MSLLAGGVMSQSMWSNAGSRFDCRVIFNIRKMANNFFGVNLPHLLVNILLIWSSISLDTPYVLQHVLNNVENAATALLFFFKNHLTFFPKLRLKGPPTVGVQQCSWNVIWKALIRSSRGPVGAGGGRGEVRESGVGVKTCDRGGERPSEPTNWQARGRTP